MLNSGVTGEKGFILLMCSQHSAKWFGGLFLVDGIAVHDIAVFWDFQNIGMKQDSSFATDVLGFLKGRGRVVAAYAYADWLHAPEETANVLFRNRYESDSCSFSYEEQCRCPHDCTCDGPSDECTYNHGVCVNQQRL